MLLSNGRLARIPCNSDTEFPSMLNSSMFTQFLSDCGITVKRLYRKPSRAKLTRFPIVSGISSRSLCCKSRALRFLQLPISIGLKKKSFEDHIDDHIKRTYRWINELWEMSNISKFTRHPIALGRVLILFSRRLSIVSLSKWRISSLTFLIRLNRR